MRQQTIDEPPNLYELPYIAVFRDYVQAYVPSRQLVTNPSTSSAADYVIPCTNFLPFKKLSSETTREIFISACGKGVLGVLARSLQDQLRLTLQLVCQDWRQIVINTPILWNDLDLRITSRHGSSGHGKVSKVTLADADSWIHRARTWLHYAGNSLISLHLLVFPCVEIGMFPVVLSQRVISFLSDYKFRTLSVHAPIVSFIDFDESLNASLRCVKTLSLSAPMSTYPLMRLYWRPPLFSSLKYLSLTLNDAFVCEDLVFAFPWHQLHQLQLGTIDRLDLTADILSRCKSLVNCTIHADECNGSSVYVNDIHLLHLRRLSLAGNIIGSVNECILTATIAPKLTTLSVLGLFGTSMATLEAVKSMAMRSGFKSNLQELVLRSMEGVVDLRSVIGFFPSLRFVEVINTTADQVTLDSLAEGSAGPCLREIHLAGYDLKPAALLDMVAGRQERANRSDSKITPFVSASFCFPSTQFEDIAAQYSDRVARLRAKHNIELMLGSFLHIPDYGEIANDETALKSGLVDVLTTQS